MKNFINDLLLFWGIRKIEPPTPFQVALDQLYKARIELLEAQKVKEEALASVDKLTARVRRLDAEVRNMQELREKKTLSVLN